MVTTPGGRPVAMVHCNNCTNDLNTWIQLFQEYSQSVKAPVSVGDIYEAFYAEAAKGEPDCGGVVVCNYMAGEPVAGMADGCPMVLRMEKNPFTLANFCRASLYATIATLKIGMDILEKEQVHVSRLMGHGGLFRNGNTGARFLAAAVKTKVSTMKTAAMGGPYGMALLAAYERKKKEGESLENFLEKRVFGCVDMTETEPDPVDVQGFCTYMNRFKILLKAERAVLENLELGRADNNA